MQCKRINIIWLITLRCEMRRAANRLLRFVLYTTRISCLTIDLETNARIAMRGSIAWLHMFKT